MKLLMMIPAAVLMAGCASNAQQPPATATTAPTQPAATQQSTAIVDPVGSYEFSTVVDGQTVTGTMHVEGTPGNYKGRIITSVFPEIPIVGASVESNTVILRGSMPDGELVIRMAMEGQNFKGNWALGGGSGEISGKKLTAK
jgi:PBP1b-binding outer membrane lipoprotein LpoB